jgi:predicted membrane protein
MRTGGDGRNDMEMQSQTPRRRIGIDPGFVVGLLILVAGVILLLDQMGFADLSYMFQFWPVALIVLGLTHLVQPGDIGRRTWGGMLTIFGSLLLANRLGYTDIRVWQLVWPLILIGVGVAIVSGHLQSRRNGGRAPDSNAVSDLNEVAVFSGGERRIQSKEFHAGRLTAVFGGFKVDFREAGMKGNEAFLEMNAFFGGGEIRVPDNWNVVMNGTAMFGGYNDRTRHPQRGPDSKDLILKGTVMFGGVEVRN